MSTFIPPDTVSQIQATPRESCPYCSPEIPCALHQEREEPVASPLRPWRHASREKLVEMARTLRRNLKEVEDELTRRK